MGASLTAAACVTAFPHLDSDRSRVVLVVMANTAMDADKPPLYFGGSARLAEALGFEPRSKSGARAVRRALRQLVEAGYIRQVPNHKRSHNRRWELLLELGTRTPVDNSTSEQ